MSEAQAKPPAPWTRWLDRGVWVLLAGFLLYQCVLPRSGGLPPQEVRVSVDPGRAALLAFDGSR